MPFSGNVHCTDLTRADCEAVSDRNYGRPCLLFLPLAHNLWRCWTQDGERGGRSQPLLPQPLAREADHQLGQGEPDPRWQPRRDPLRRRLLQQLLNQVLLKTGSKLKEGFRLLADVVTVDLDAWRAEVGLMQVDRASSICSLNMYSSSYTNNNNTRHIKGCLLVGGDFARQEADSSLLPQD